MLLHVPNSFPFSYFYKIRNSRKLHIFIQKEYCWYLYQRILMLSVSNWNEKFKVWKFGLTSIWSRLIRKLVSIAHVMCNEVDLYIMIFLTCLKNVFVKKQQKLLTLFCNKRKNYNKICFINTHFSDNLFFLYTQTRHIFMKSMLLPDDYFYLWKTQKDTELHL